MVSNVVLCDLCDQVYKAKYASARCERDMMTLGLRAESVAHGTLDFKPGSALMDLG